MAEGSDGLKVIGAMLLGFAKACVNLSIVADEDVCARLDNIELMTLYPMSRLAELERLVLRTYDDSEPIFERVGREISDSWYHRGPGKDIIRSGVGFLRFQSGSEGYTSAVEGPDHLAGAFELEALDETAGTATIQSTTPFDRSLERGIILGGMLAPGDLVYVTVDNSEDPNLFRIEFH